MLNERDKISILTKDINLSSQSVNGHSPFLKASTVIPAGHLTVSPDPFVYLFVVVVLFFFLYLMKDWKFINEKGKRGFKGL